MNLISVARVGIHLYQRHLSPYKGFRCAHAAYHGGASCSQAVLSILESRGFPAAWPAVRARFADCREAHALLRAARAPGDVRAQGVCCCGPIPIPFRCG